MLMSRHLTLEGIANFRDFGDYPVAGGGRLKPRTLYRSASHSRATDADLETLASLDLAVVVDLRRKSEQEREPSRRPPGFSGVVIVDDTEDARDDWREQLAHSDLSAESFRGYMINFYGQAPFDPPHIDVFSRHFKTLAQTDGAVLIHCAAGKDRTGILAALTLHAAGVHRDDIMHDYLLTNRSERTVSNLPQVAETIRDICGRMPDEAAMMTIMGVDAVYLETSFRALTDRFGGADAYLEQVLGVTPAIREALTARLVA
jgi:protein tyrosine/serine phosphatase